MSGVCYRLDVEASPALATTARFGAYLKTADWFDAGMFGLSLAEASLMDPQQRLLLEAAVIPQMRFSYLCLSDSAIASKRKIVLTALAVAW